MSREDYMAALMRHYQMPFMPEFVSHEDWHRTVMAALRAGYNVDLVKGRHPYPRSLQYRDLR